ncbi:unnamed protein product [Pedinophyceae sp. YPF-701]|nr:unnamed protein product [Pedinophyceae sp. YPF-701]
MHQTHGILVVSNANRHLLHPLTSNDTPIALLPICNQPLIYYSLEAMRRSGIAGVTVLIQGSPEETVHVSQWLARFQKSDRSAGLRLDVEVIPSEGATAATVLRSSLDRIRGADTVLFMQGDCITSVPLEKIVSYHRMHRALCTVALSKRPSPSEGLKPGKAPRGVDYVAVDKPSGELLLFQPSAQPDKAVTKVDVPAAALQRAKAGIEITTSFRDVGVYVCHVSALKLLSAYPGVTSIPKQLIPLLILVAGDDLSRHGSGSARNSVDTAHPAESEVADHIRTALRMSHGTQESSGAANGGARSFCGAFVLPESEIAVRVDTLASYAAANAAVSDPKALTRLTPLVPNDKHHNFVHNTCSLMGKVQVGPGCVVGEGCAVGEKVSIKKSVIGPAVRVGSGAKIINSVVMEGAVIEDGAHVASSVVCARATVRERAVVKDAQVGMAQEVATGADVRQEAVAKVPATPPGHDAM